jgi:MtN3 and saliva related transmembrane protein
MNKARWWSTARVIYSHASLLGSNFLSGAETISLLYGEILGLIGGALTTFGYVPQFVRILQLKSAREISLPFTLSFLAGAICWLAYGVLSNLMPVIVWNMAGIIFLCMLLYGKLKYGR